MMATHEFALGLYFIVEPEVAESIAHHPPSRGDWLNLAQHLVVWLSHFILYV